MGKNKSKGFSLFTPLVGTAVVVMTVLIASSIVQNDVRISRSITTSYMTSSQGVAAKLIKASAELHILEQMRKGTETFLTSPYVAYCGNNDYEACITNAKNYYEKADTLDLELTTGSNGIFYGITDSVLLTARYTPTKLGKCSLNSACLSETTAKSQLDCCLSAALADIYTKHRSIAEQSFENADCPYGKYQVNLVPSRMQNYDAFNVEFQSQTDSDNKIVISIVPSALGYENKKPIGDYICALGETFRAADTGNYGTVELPIDAIEGWMCVDGDEFSVRSFWELDKNKLFDLTYQTSGYTKGGEFFYLRPGSGAIKDSTSDPICLI